MEFVLQEHYDRRQKYQEFLDRNLLASSDEFAVQLVKCGLKLEPASLVIAAKGLYDTFGYDYPNYHAKVLYVASTGTEPMKIVWEEPTIHQAYYDRTTRCHVLMEQVTKGPWTPEHKEIFRQILQLNGLKVLCCQGQNYARFYTPSYYPVDDLYNRQEPFFMRDLCSRELEVEEPNEWHDSGLIVWAHDPDPLDNNGAPVRILAAALRGQDGNVITGRRHMCPLMQAMFRNYPDLMENYRHAQGVDQGFVDTMGCYRTRFEAFHIAQQARQINLNSQTYKDVGMHERLYSEMLW